MNFLPYSVHMHLISRHIKTSVKDVPPLVAGALLAAVHHPLTSPGRSRISKAVWGCNRCMCGTAEALQKPITYLVLANYTIHLFHKIQCYKIRTLQPSLCQALSNFSPRRIAESAVENDMTDQNYIRETKAVSDPWVCFLWFFLDFRGLI